MVYWNRYYKGLVIIQAVSGRLLTAQAQSQTPGRPCGIYNVKMPLGQFIPEYLSFLISGSSYTHACSLTTNAV